MEGWRIENVFTVMACGASMVGLYAVGAGHHSFWALLILLNLNAPVKREAKDGD